MPQLLHHPLCKVDIHRVAVQLSQVLGGLQWLKFKGKARSCRKEKKKKTNKQTEDKMEWQKSGIPPAWKTQVFIQVSQILVTKSQCLHAFKLCSGILLLPILKVKTGLFFFYIKYKIIKHLLHKTVSHIWEAIVPIRAAVHELCAREGCLWLLLSQGCQTKIAGTGKTQSTLGFTVYFRFCTAQADFKGKAPIHVSQLQLLKLFTLKSLYYSGAGGDIWK